MVLSYAKLEYKIARPTNLATNCEKNNMKNKKVTNEVYLLQLKKINSIY